MMLAAALDPTRRFLNRLPLAIGAIALFASGLVIHHNWQAEHDALDHQADIWARELRVDLDEAVTYEAQALAQTLRVIGAQPQLKQALAQQATDRLRSDWMTVFDQLRIKDGVTHFSFIGPGRESMLRLHMPAPGGDRVDRHAVLDAERSGDGAWGVEADSSGTLSLRAVQPVFDNGHLLGYVELGKDLHPLLATPRRSTEHGYLYAILLQKEHIDRPRWERAMQAMARDATWDDLPRHVVEYHDPKLTVAALADILARFGSDPAHGTAEVDGRIWDLQAAPLGMVGGTDLGELVVVRDVTDSVHAIGRRAAVLALTTLLVAASTLLLFAWAMKRLFHRIEDQEARLVDSEARFHTLFDSSPDPVWIMEEHRFSECNQAAVEMLGFPDKRAFNDVHPADISPEYQPDGETSFAKAERMMSVAQDKGLLRFEWVHRRRDGSEFDAEVTLSEIVLQGRPVLHAVVRDVSERKRAENALRQSKEELRTILDGVEAYIYLKDTDGNYLFANAAVRRLWQAEMEDIIGSGDERFFDAETAANIRRNDRQVLVDGQTLRAEETNTVTATGLTFTYWSVKLPLRGEDGRIYALCGISTDISARKRIEERLRKSEHDLKEAQRIARVGSWELDIPNGRLAWSDEIYRIFELDPDRFGASYDAFLDAIHPDDRETVNTAYVDSLRTRRPYSIRHRLRMTDGRIKHVREECRTDFDEAGTALRSVGTVQDVTEQVQAEIALDDARNLLQAVIDHVPMRIFWKDRSLHYLGCNPPFARDAGLARPDDLVGKDDYQMAWASHAELYRADDQQVVESGMPRLNYEEPQTTPDGRTIWLRTSKVPLRNQREEIIGVLGLYEDVTETRERDDELARYRDHLEQIVAERSAQLSEVQVKYQRLVDDIGDEFLVFSLTPQGTATYVSNGFEAIFGFPREKILGQSWIDAIQWLPEDRTVASQAVRDLLRDEADCIRFEARFIHPDGQLRTIYQTGRAARNAAGDIVSVDGVLTDITRRKRFEMELLEAKLTAEAANRAKSAFLANMTHEIRTPMNGVIGMLEILSRSPLPDEKRKMVETTRHSARSLLGIIDDILDFSKIEAGKLSLAEQETSLESELDAVVGLLDGIAMDKQVDLTMYFDPTLPRRVVGDGLRVRQILTNLAGNAVKFSAGMAHVGRVHLRAERERCDDTRVWVAFRIVDNGIGMDAETVSGLFLPFEQADNSTTRKFGGTGLGLSISRNLASMMGGEISVHSEPGQGSSFTVRLPFKLASECPDTTSPYDLSGLEAIVVASELRCAEDYTRYLVHAGARTHAFTEAEAAGNFVIGLTATRPICMIVVQQPGSRPAAQIAEGLPATRSRANLRFVEIGCRGIERGKRRRVRRLSDCVVQIDREALTRHRFLEAAAVALGRVAAPQASDDGDCIEADDQATCRILVAEDNEVNREVIRRQLELLGHSVELAEDGQTAFDKWEKGDYDLLLTDLHMPNKDGYELAALIRETEGRRARRPLPIIALTANAMKGEEERCLDQGMNAYLSKPIELDRLKAVLDRWHSVPTPGGPAGPPATVKLPATEPAELPVFDVDVMAKTVGINPAFHERLLRTFLTNLLGQQSVLQAARAEQDLVATSRIAHALKSAARAVGAMQLGDLCERLERAAGRGDADASRHLASRFDEACEAATTAIRDRLGE